MILSRQKQFIFIANVKTASTSIETALKKYADIHVRTTRSGKHMSMREVENTFIQHWPVKYIGEAGGYFKFGVIREPVSWFLSIYNSHSKRSFLGTPQYTGDITVEDYLERLSGGFSGIQWQLRDQRLRFCNNRGELAIDYLIRYENLKTDFRYVNERLGLEVNLPHANKSPEKACIADLEASTRKRIESLYAEDYRFYQEYAGRIPE